MQADIDPRNSKLLRHAFNINSVQTNPEKVDMSSVTPVLDWGQGGYCRSFDHSFMRSCNISLSTDLAGELYLAQSLLVKTSSDPSTETQICIPPGHDFYLMKAAFHFQIEEFPWLVMFAGRSLIFRIGSKLPSDNATLGYVDKDVINSKVTIETWKNTYRQSFCPKKWIPEGGSCGCAIMADNSSGGFTSYGSWRLGGGNTGMDMPRNLIGPPPQIALFWIQLWGILVPHGVQAPANIVC